MKSFLEEYGMFIAYFIIALTLVAVLAGSTYEYTSLKEQVPEVQSVSAGDNRALAGKELPTLKVKSSIIAKGTAFRPLDHVLQATDRNGHDIKSQVAVYGADKVDVDQKGVYIVTYTVRDQEGLAARQEATFLVD